jgi:hypothetical protein
VVIDINLNPALNRQGREGKQSTSLIIKITNLVIASGFTSVLISLASLASFAVKSFFQDQRAGSIAFKPPM